MFVRRWAAWLLPGLRATRGQRASCYTWWIVSQVCSSSPGKEPCCRSPAAGTEEQASGRNLRTFTFGVYKTPLPYSKKHFTPIPIANPTLIGLPSRLSPSWCALLSLTSLLITSTASATPSARSEAMATGQASTKPPDANEYGGGVSPRMDARISCMSYSLGLRR